MKQILGTNLIKAGVLFVCTILLATAASAQSVTAVNENIYNYLQLLRSDVNSAKVDAINRIIKLSAIQAGQFLQIENQVGLFIDVTIAAEMPLVGKLGNK